MTLAPPYVKIRWKQTRGGSRTASRQRRPAKPDEISHCVRDDNSFFYKRAVVGGGKRAALPPFFLPQPPLLPPAGPVISNAVRDLPIFCAYLAITAARLSSGKRPWCCRYATVFTPQSDKGHKGCDAGTFRSMLKLQAGASESSHC